MALHRIRRGLDLPVDGAPGPELRKPPAIGTVAVLADDYPGLRPRVRVEEGSTVRRGQLLFEDRSSPGVRFTSPGSGRVAAIHRGARRALQSVVIELTEPEHSAEEECVEFEAFSGAGATPERDAVVALLVESGLWTALRTRPFSRVPSPESRPFALFVTAIDTQPLSPDPEVVVDASRDVFRRGLELLSTLTDGPTYLCVARGSAIADIDAPVTVEEFDGPHPAGLAGLHIHLLAPVSRERVVWSIGYQDVISIGRLFATGRLDIERVISIAGPPVKRPRLVHARVGASLTDLTRSDALAGDVRLISGSMLSGKTATRPEYRFLGRYDRQVTVLSEDRERRFLGWLAPGRRVFSVLPLFLSNWIRSKPELTTSSRGAPRAMVPLGVYERVMPMEILPTFLLRSLLVGDLERAEELGCLELDEEDLALCTFVCPSKIDYGPVLRHNLERLAAEGE